MLAEIQRTEIADRAVRSGAIGHFATGNEGQPRLNLPADRRLRELGQKHQRARGENLPELTCHHASPNSFEI
ncbi:hypothetical protein D3C76_1821820 [compost metagenome]